MPWENKKEEQEEWKAWRFLGAGGHGGAALWIKIDEEGNLLDEIVLKEQQDPRRQFRFQGYRRYLTRLSCITWWISSTSAKVSRLSCSVLTQQPVTRSLLT